MQKILSLMRQCIDKYNMISEGDRIAVGVSGGKDSLVLLQALHMYSKFSPVKFSVVGITIDMFGEGGYDQISAWCSDNGIEYHIVPSDIYQIVFVERKEKSPCSLCSKLRRGMLNTTALQLHCNKLALGHTADDVVDTFMLSLFYEGRLSCFAPVTYLDRTGMTVIRPLILVDEMMIRGASKKLPVMTSKCPVDKHTKREYVRDVVKEINKTIPNVAERIHGAITHPERYNLFDNYTPDGRKKS